MRSRSKKIVITTQDKTFYRFDRITGFWGKPNIEREVFFKNHKVTIRVRHNSEGNRDMPFSPDLHNHTILCFGGSHTWGGAVDQEERYTDRLTAKTNRRFVNMGHCSLGLDQICLAILTRARFYSPSVIIIEQYPWAIHRILNTYVNGHLKPFFYLDSKGELKLQKLSRLARSKFYRKVIGTFHSYKKELQEFRGGIDLKNDYDPRTDPIFLYWKGHYYDYMYSLAGRLMNVIQGHCAQQNYKLLFFLGASHQKFGPESGSSLIDYDLPAKRLKRLLEERGIAYVDMAKHLIEEHSPEDPTIHYDGHINAKGHGIVARVLERELEKREWIS